MSKYYDSSVFINCPFDDGYKDIFYAIVFTVYRCGFIPRSSLEEDNALHNRLSKIESIIEQCRYGIHDLSRTEFYKGHLPRFNMPFELGLFFGAKKFGDGIQKNKVALVLENKKYSYQQSLSDISGADTKAHQNEPEKSIKIVRDWLKNASKSNMIDGHKIIIGEYANFKQELLPLAIKKLGLDIEDLSFNDYCELIESSIKSYMFKL